MFDELETTKSSEEKKVLLMEILAACGIVAVAGVVLVWFFGYYGT